MYYTDLYIWILIFIIIDFDFFSFMIIFNVSNHLVLSLQSIDPSIKSLHLFLVEVSLPMVDTAHKVLHVECHLGESYRSIFAYEEVVGAFFMVLGVGGDVEDFPFNAE